MQACNTQNQSRRGITSLAVNRPGTSGLLPDGTSPTFVCCGQSLPSTTGGGGGQRVYSPRLPFPGASWPSWLLRSSGPTFGPPPGPRKGAGASCCAVLLNIMTTAATTRGFSQLSNFGCCSSPASGPGDQSAEDVLLFRSRVTGMPREPQCNLVYGNVSSTIFSERTRM